MNVKYYNCLVQNMLDERNIYYELEGEKTMKIEEYKKCLDTDIPNNPNEFWEMVLENLRRKGLPVIDRLLEKTVMEKIQNSDRYQAIQI